MNLPVLKQEINTNGTNKETRKAFFNFPHKIPIKTGANIRCLRFAVIPYVFAVGDNGNNTTKEQTSDNKKNMILHPLL